MKRLYACILLALCLPGCSIVPGNEQAKSNISGKSDSKSKTTAYNQCLEKAKTYCQKHRLLCWTPPEKWCHSPLNQRHIGTAKL